MFLQTLEQRIASDDVADNAMYWNFVVVAWLPIYGCICWVPPMTPSSIRFVGLAVAPIAWAATTQLGQILPWRDCRGFEAGCSSRSPRRLP